VQSGEQRQQRRVDVQHAAGVVLDEGHGQDAHEAGQHHQVGREAVDGLLQGGVEGFARREFLVVDHGGRNAVRLREREPLGVGLIADHGGNTGRPLLRLRARARWLPYCCRGQK
jgi:hypothetical protein